RVSMLGSRDPREARQAFLDALESAQRALALIEREQDRLLGRKLQLEEQISETKLRGQILEQDLETRKISLTAKIAENGFSSLEAVQEALLEEQEADILASKIQEFQEQL